jgi:hypothetical protein
MATTDRFGPRRAEQHDAACGDRVQCDA